MARLLFLLLAFSGSALAQPTNLAGDYTCHAYCPAGGEGARARVEQRGTALVFINEGGNRSSGAFVDASSVVAKDWGGLRATVSNGGMELHWANRTVWRRVVPDLAGDYTCHAYCPAGGEGARARVEQQGLTLVFINEGGNRSSGAFVDSSNVVANDWGGLRAAVQAEGKELHWANRTVWRRK
jgi:hypothetical protein